MRGKKISVLIICLFLVISVSCKNHSIVKIDGGFIKGEETVLGFYFRGIPYAEPPVGKLRFANPKQYSQTWEGVRSYDDYGPSCAQYLHFGYEFMGEEDCLTLNVFVPRLVKEGSEKAPVIFFIHGGAFMFGGSAAYGPENFMNHQKMIVVTVNYRLGILGFLSTVDEAIPGNYGLKDQVEALKWVQRNIEAFNGDPKKVTLSGFSAGGASVHLHYMSPLSDGLFNNGISHSGCALNPWAIQENAKEKANDLGNFLKCGHTDHVSLVKCLRTKQTEELVMFAKQYQPIMYNPFSPFGPVVEAASDTAFITDHPLNYLKEGKYKQVPWLFSQTLDDGLYPAVEFADDKKLSDVNTRWLELAPALLDFDYAAADEETKLAWTSKIKQNYFKDNAISMDSFFDFRQMMTDRLYHHGAHKALQYQSQKSETFFYLFKADTYNVLPIDPSWVSNYEISPDIKKYGVAHGDDVFLIYFTIGSRGVSKMPYTKDEKVLSKKLLEMYYSFAMTGKPSLGDSPFDAVKFDKTLTANEIISPSKLVTIHLNSTFGSSDLWDSLQINEN